MSLEKNKSRPLIVMTIELFPPYPLCWAFPTHSLPDVQGRPWPSCAVGDVLLVVQSTEFPERGGKAA